MSKILIKKEVFKKLPKLRVSFILVRGINNRSKLKESKQLLQETADLVKLIFNKESPKTHHLIQPWTAAKEHFGDKAHHYHTALENLLQKTIKNKKIISSDVCTNLTNYLSLKHLVPLAIDNLDKLQGDLIFQLAKKKSKKTTLKNLQKGDLYYQDDKGILGTKLDSWKNKKTSPNKSSKNIILHIDALPPTTNQKLNDITKETAKLIESFCGGKASYFILYQNKNSHKL
ncbi:hypothetical protein HOC13_02670 [Candidatus Woesearchaeota archaeon]|jgi:DNA/RNA-binding domain of Phe-tRNA-synthetase-like protein|nr:hypothetical protein [Candidatus Woesearchaeota archaeon]